MFFTAFEQRATSTAFDKFMEATNSTLENPLVTARLGKMATEIQQVIDSAFLPNIKDGKFAVPKSQQDSDSLAFVPLTNRQADNANQVTAALYAGPPVRSWPAHDAAYSFRYGLDLAKDLNALNISPDNDPSAIIKGGLKPGALARAAARWGRSPDGTYWMSRPNLMVRRSLLKRGTVECGAVIAHEAIHVSDFLEDGALMGTLQLGGASELRAYHVSATIYKAHGIDTPKAQDDISLDEMREQEIGHTNRPFTLNATLMDMLIQTGKV